MTISNDRKTVLRFLVLMVVLAIIAASCAHAPPALWEICRDACAVNGGSAAAVVGSTKPKPGEKPACMCGAPTPAGGGT